jgi:membrane dipeptidase
MRVFDLHCDTLTAPAPFAGHVTLEQGRALDAWAQVFAIFVPDTLRGRAAAEYLGRALALYETRRAEIESVCRPLLALENGSALARDLQNLDSLAARRVRIVTLTWNGENELGYGARCDPRLGLKPFGRQAVERMFALGIFPDVSHLNPAGFWDVMGIAAGRPVLATHSNCAAARPHCRNLDDAQLRALFACGGLVGLNLYTEFLGGAGAAEDVARHLAHLYALGGEAHAALGSDFDGCEVHPSLAGTGRLEALDRALERLGFTSRQRAAFFWENAERVIGRPPP